MKKTQFHNEGLMLTKKRKTIVSPDLKAAVWDVYIGAGMRKAPCPLCSVNEISSANMNSGFETAHIVADKFFPDKTKLSVYYLYPSCSACNNICHDQCILDFLYVRARFGILKRMLVSLYTVYVEEFPHLSFEDRLMWRMLENLYGHQRFPSGGGLQNEMPLYSMAKSLQIDYLSDKISTLAKELAQVSGDLQRVATMTITVTAPKFV